MSVGYKLYREVLDFAPADLSSGEMVVALVIADDANDRARLSWIPLPLLCARTRLKPSSVRAALAKLASRGLEFRVIHGYGKDGRPVFAARSHATDYAVPDMLKGASGLAPFTSLEPVDNWPAKAAAGAASNGYPHPKGARNPGKGARELAAIGEKGARELAPLPSKNLTPPQKNPSTEALDLSAAPVEGARARAGRRETR